MVGWVTTGPNLDAEGSGKLVLVGLPLFRGRLCASEGEARLLLARWPALPHAHPFSPTQILMSAWIRALPIHRALIPLGATSVPVTLALHQAVDG